MQWHNEAMQMSRLLRFRWLRTRLLLHGASLARAGKTLVVWAIVFGFVTRVVPVFRYTHFQDDQARDAGAILAVADGSFAALGPPSSVGGYRLPPLAYYLVAPFTVLGSDPVWQALPNALFGWLAIPLLMVLVFRLFERTERQQRIFLAGLGGVWWSVLFPDILLSSVEWNPSPIPFFLFLGLLLAEHALRGARHRSHLLLWLALGALLALFVSLHSTTLFVMPVAFAVAAFVSIRRSRQWRTPLAGLGVCLLLLAPYWKGEMSTGWTNTRAMFATIAATQQERHGVVERIDRAAFNYLELGPLAFFPHLPASSLPQIFLISVSVLGLFGFRGNLRLLAGLLLVWTLASAAAANFWSTLYIHYKLLLLAAPLLLALSALAATDRRGVVPWIVRGLVSLGILASIAANVRADLFYLDAKYGRNRLLTTYDLTAALRAVPEGASVCAPQDARAYAYLDEHLARRRLTFTAVCAAGMVQIQPRCLPAENFSGPPRCTSVWPAAHTVLRATRHYRVIVL